MKIVALIENRFLWMDINIRCVDTLIFLHLFALTTTVQRVLLFMVYLSKCYFGKGFKTFFNDNEKN